jgi:hypothetical protein
MSRLVGCDKEAIISEYLCIIIDEAMLEVHIVELGIGDLNLPDIGCEVDHALSICECMEVDELTPLQQFSHT